MEGIRMFVMSVEEIKIDGKNNLQMSQAGVDPEQMTILSDFWKAVSNKNLIIIHLCSIW